MYRKFIINQTDRPDEPRVYVAGTVCDAAGVSASPGAVAVDASGHIIGAGPADDVLRTIGSDICRVDLPDHLLIPSLVNAHTHLDLTGIGHQPYSGDFVEWVKMVMAQKPQHVGRGGAEQSVTHGVLTVGDIGGAVDRERGLRGVGFSEWIGHGDGAMAVAEGFTGVQPHAPYSTGPAVYRQAIASGLPLSTHLAETRDELEFVAHGRGPFRQLLEQMGKWSDAIASHYNQGLHPVEWLKEIAKPQAAWLCAHCNYVEDAHIETMAARGWSVAYCPRASDYFQHRGHRYRDMIDAGVNVCLGTDSIICHGTLSILDEMRHLHQRDAIDPQTLLKMATINGMRGLQLGERHATFAPGARPGVIALHYDPHESVDALTQTLACQQSPDIQVLEGVVEL